MKETFNSLVQQLRCVCNSFDQVAVDNQNLLLRKLVLCPLPKNKSLRDYADLLLFISAHPANAKILAIVQKEMLRIASFLQRISDVKKNRWLNTGLPFTKISTRFSHDCLKWLLLHKGCYTSISSIDETNVKLSDVLRFTLPSLEREYAAAGNRMEAVLSDLSIKEKDHLSFIVDQFSELNERPLLKDFLFEKLDMYVEVEPKVKTLSRTFNKLSFAETFYHDDLIKRFDHMQLLNTALPLPLEMSKTQKQQCIEVIRNAMLLEERETDPTTYMEEQSLRVYALERGISIAIYGMTPDRQLPLESYIGYTLFKNGYPASYGGGWVFGRRSLFGINIFESFRGGESGLILCQLLRVYRQAFGVDYFEVEPYQYGADNPDGIKSGAFWFYYRFGFRPINKELDELAKKEFEKIKTRKGYRSSERTLTRFTDSNIALRFAGGIPPSVPETSAKVTSMVSKQFQGNRQLAVASSMELLLKNSEEMKRLDKNERRVAEELALYAAVHHIKDAKQLQILKEMIQAKPVDVFRYQELWNQFFKR